MQDGPWTKKLFAQLHLLANRKRDIKTEVNDDWVEPFLIRYHWSDPDKSPKGL